MQKELSIISKTFKVETCEGGDPKLFSQLSTWELLNLKVSTILDIPDRLQKEYGISSKFLQNSFGKYSIQTIGKDALEKEFEISKPIQYMESATKYCSWPKAAGGFKYLILATLADKNANPHPHHISHHGHWL
jgi:hypothetical protein